MEHTKGCKMSTEDKIEASTSQQSESCESEDKKIFSEFNWLSEIDVSTNVYFVVDFSVTEYDRNFSFLSKQRFLTNDEHTVFVHGHGCAPRRCKLRFENKLLNNEICMIPTRFNVENLYQATIQYVPQSKISHWHGRHDALLEDYTCGDSTFSCNSFYHLQYTDNTGWTKECILCTTCYRFQDNTNLWVIYNILSLNQIIYCNVIHVHGSGHYHCMHCLMDTRNYQFCPRFEVAELNECFSYWVSEKCHPVITE